jgi:hypothetical protein
VSAAGRGAYYKARTKRWFEARGWHVADLEVVRWVGAGPVRFPVKRDQFGADLLLVGFERIVFVQVKGGQQAEGRGTFAAARREFAQHYVPRWVEQVIVAWAPGAQVPRIIDAREETANGEKAIEDIEAEEARNQRDASGRGPQESQRTLALDGGEGGAAGPEAARAPEGTARAAIAWCRRGPRDHGAR